MQHVEGDIDIGPVQIPQVGSGGIDQVDGMTEVSQRIGDSLAAFEADASFGGISAQQDGNPEALICVRCCVIHCCGSIRCAGLLARD